MIYDCLHKSSLKQSAKHKMIWFTVNFLTEIGYSPRIKTLVFSEKGVEIRGYSLVFKNNLTDNQ